MIDFEIKILHLRFRKDKPFTLVTFSKNQIIANPMHYCRDFKAMIP